MSEKSRIAFILDNSHSPSTGFNSSPVVRGPETLAAPEARSNEAQDVPLPANGDTPPESNGEEVALPLQPSVENPPKRSELFSMIENLRSSSPPTNTPKELGFMTPPHLRNLRNPDREAETPQTPTLPAIAAENDESFLGSSPTPGTRDRSQSSGSTLRTSLVAPAVVSEMDIDPPSSPPDIRSNSPNSRSKSVPMEGSTVRDKTAKNRRRKQRRRERRSQASAASSPVKQPEPPATPKEASKPDAAQPERPPSSRTRSSTGKMPEDAPETSSAGIHQELEHTTPVQSPSKDHDIVLEDAPSQENPEVETGVGHDEMRSENPDIPDSSSDDMDTQIASQIEQEFESAVVDEADGEPNKPPVTRKRKREAREMTFSTPSNQDRRRSSRLSTTTKEHPATEDTEPKSARSKKPTALSGADQTASSPADGGPQKRRRRSKGAVDNEEPQFALPEQNSSIDAYQTANAVENSSQKRRSNRLSGHVAPTPAEETPGPKKQSPRSSRSRKQNTKQRESTSTASQVEIPAEKTNIKTKSTEKEKRKTQENLTVELSSNEIPETSDSRIFNSNSNENTSQHTQSLEIPDTTQSSEPALPSGQQQQPPPPQQDATQMSDAAAADPPVEKTPKTKTKTKAGKQKPKSTDPAAETKTATPPAAEKGEIIPALQQILDNVKAAALDRSALKQIDDLLFDIRVETHEALRRHTG